MSFLCFTSVLHIMEQLHGLVHLGPQKRQSITEGYLSFMRAQPGGDTWKQKLTT